MTASVAVVVCWTVPLVPVLVRVTPGLPVVVANLRAVIVSVELPPVTWLGLKDAFVPPGKPVTFRLTVPVKFWRVIVIEYCVLEPRRTDWLGGVTESEKSDDGGG